MRPIGLFYWALDNFGDGLSPLVVAHISGRSVKRASAKDCELVAVGSILQMIPRRGSDDGQEGTRPWIWGTGIIRPVSPVMMQRVRVAALRGPVTATLMEQSPSTPCGDPGIFADELLDERPRRTKRIGVVPHWKLAECSALRSLLTNHPELVLIDPRNADPIDVVRRIAECRYILSSSLHGLVVADSLGIPNHWLNPTGNHVHPALKFTDYAASVGRMLGAPLELDRLPAFIAGELPETIAYADGLVAAKQALRDSFPSELKAS